MRALRSAVNRWPADAACEVLGETGAFDDG
jgi:hypothetical protein